MALSFYTFLSKLPGGGLFVWFVLGIGLLALDIAARWWCFYITCSSRLFPGFGLAVFPNYYFAFSLPVPVPIMYGVYVAALAIIIWYIITRWSRFGAAGRVAWVLVLVGALGNVGERTLCGYVRDFIQIGTGYINLGDVYIITGAAYVLYYSFARER